MSETVDFGKLDPIVPWDDIPLSDVVDEGRYELRVKELKQVGSAQGKLMVQAHFVIESGVLTGVPFPIQNYVLGSDDDPLCRDPNTYKRTFGGRQLHQLINACGTLKDPHLSITLARATDARFQAYVTKTTQDKGEYANMEQNRITRFAAFGVDMVLPGRARAASAASGASNGGQRNVPVQPRHRMRPDVTGGMAPAQAPEILPEQPGDTVLTIDKVEDDLPF